MTRLQVYLATLGCRLNEAELEHWSRTLRAAGDRVVDRPEQAQVVVVNTCAVTAEAARKSRKLVAGLHRQSPAARLVLTGCFAELEPDAAARLAGVDRVVGNADKDELPRLLDELRAELTAGEMPALASEPDADVYAHVGRTRAFVKVQDGCRNRCTFCIVTVARGEERSRTINDIVGEVRALHRAGYREAVLTGVHLGGYGADLGTDLRAMVSEVLARTEIPRVRLSSLEPWDLPARFFELWREPRLMPHLHLPLQSGSDSVLRRMSRRCYTRDYAALVADARAHVPDLTITTDIIVGFPGESAAEWADTVSFVDSIGFGHIHIFGYSAREGTKAARLPGHLPRDVKRARSRQLHALAARHKRAHLARFVGGARPVLWEGDGEPTDDGVRFRGYTDNYLRVEAVVPVDLDVQNRITSTHLVAVDDAGEQLIGSPLGDLGQFRRTSPVPKARPRGLVVLGG